MNAKTEKYFQDDPQRKNRSLLFSAFIVKK
jgi:hypothetical protein